MRLLLLLLLACGLGCTAAPPVRHAEHPRTGHLCSLRDLAGLLAAQMTVSLEDDHFVLDNCAWPEAWARCGATDHFITCRAFGKTNLDCIEGMITLIEIAPECQSRPDLEGT